MSDLVARTGGKDPQHSFRAYVAEVPGVSTVVAPLIRCDVALPASSEGEWLFRLSMSKDSLALVVRDVFIQSPNRRAFLNHGLAVND